MIDYTVLPLAFYAVAGFGKLGFVAVFASRICTNPSRFVIAYARSRFGVFVFFVTVFKRAVPVTGFIVAGACAFDRVFGFFIRACKGAVLPVTGGVVTGTACRIRRNLTIQTLINTGVGFPRPGKLVTVAGFGFLRFVIVVTGVFAVLPLSALVVAGTVFGIGRFVGFITGIHAVIPHADCFVAVTGCIVGFGQFTAGILAIFP